MNLPDPEELLRERDERGVAFQSYVQDDDYGIAVASAEHVTQALAFGGAFEVLRHEPLGRFQPVPRRTRGLPARASRQRENPPRACRRRLPELRARAPAGEPRHGRRTMRCASLLPS